MEICLQPTALQGTLTAMPSKSSAHRLLICMALSKQTCQMPCNVFSQDIEATVRCLQALCAEIRFADGLCTVTPTPRQENPVLDCGESGSTYRFLLPVAAALGKRAEFRLGGKLPERPMQPLFAALRQHGVEISGEGTDCVTISGRLQAGRFEIPGNVSSQYLSGLLFAMPLLEQDSILIVLGQRQSQGYLHMTLQTLAEFGIRIDTTPDGFFIPGGQTYLPPKHLAPEGDWSNSAFFLCAAAVAGEGIKLTGLQQTSLQADRAVCQLLRWYGATVRIFGNTVTVRPQEQRPITVDGGEIPDLIPALVIAACGAVGESVFHNVARLRLKESDRLQSICTIVRQLGGSAEATDDTLTIYGSGFLRGGTVDSCNDHRMVMMAAGLSVLCREPVTITNAQAVAKSCPEFFTYFTALGGKEEL